MIFFTESGRVGNQLFQYAALRSMADPKERLVLVGFDELRETFQGVDATILRSDHPVSRLWRRMRPGVDRHVARIPGIGIIEEDAESRGGVQTKPGRLRYVPEAFFQSELAFSASVVAGLRLAEPVATQADQFINALPFRDRRLVFLHIRRGDYVRWPNRGAPAVLPAEWVLGALRSVRKCIQDSVVVVATDDVPYAQDVLRDDPDVVVAGQSPAVDFAIMARCEGGVLSASSFSWWAAYFADRSGASGPFIAPLHWVGHRSGEWMPSPGVQASFLKFQ